jgi:glycosyltransferase involved in cell wall biosynthesis
MRIAQIAPLVESVPPRLYGGTERIVSYLTEELVRQGHDVTLFASGDSLTSARLIASAPAAMRLDPTAVDPLPHHLRMLDMVRRHAGEFDILHFHIDLLQYPLLRLLDVPAVTTLHGRLDLPDLAPFYRGFPDLPLVSISDGQRQPMPPVNWVRTIHHGLPADLLRFRPGAAEPYLVFLGRISPEKRPDLAIEIARRAGVSLRIAAKIDRVDAGYWEAEIERLVRGNPLVEYIGEVDERGKAELLGGALALVFPVAWPEPFGLVMIEAMACGTPVIAFPRGSVPEVIEQGVSGFLATSVEEAAAAVSRVAALDRRTVRAAFDRRFTAERMAAEYVEVYEEVGAGFKGRRVLPLSA